MKTLKDALPYEFTRGEYDRSPAMKFKDVEVVAEHNVETAWPGPHKNVCYWVELANGKAVAWNENPGLGWSFPVITLKK